MFAIFFSLLARDRCRKPISCSSAFSVCSPRRGRLLHFWRPRLSRRRRSRRTRRTISSWAKPSSKPSTDQASCCPQIRDALSVAPSPWKPERNRPWLPEPHPQPAEGCLRHRCRECADCEPLPGPYQSGPGIRCPGNTREGNDDAPIEPWIWNICPCDLGPPPNP